MTPLYLPTLSHWVHRNPWSGSVAPLARYQVIPRKEEDVMDASMWHGPLRFSLSEVTATAEFPISEDGIEALRQWLTAQCELINSQS